MVDPPLAPTVYAPAETTIPVWRLARAAEAVGVDAAAVLRAHGLTIDELRSVTRRIETRRATAIANELQLQAGPASLALEAARAFDPSQFGIVGSILGHTSTLRETIFWFGRVVGLARDQARVELTVETSLATLRFRGNAVDLVAPALADLLLTTCMQMGWLLAGRHLPVTAVHFIHANRQHARAYQDFFRTRELVFGADAYAIVFPRAYLDVPMRKADASALANIASDLDRTLQSLERLTGDLVTQLRELAIEARESGVTLHAAAAKLGTTPRTLQRRLLEKGTSFDQVVEDAIRELAVSWIGTTGLTAAEVGARLGFSHASSFSRAFRRWTTDTPSAYAVKSRRQST